MGRGSMPAARVTISTPAQWLIGESPEVAGFVFERGAKADIFLAAALGDLALAERFGYKESGLLGTGSASCRSFRRLATRERRHDLPVDAALQFLSASNRSDEGA